MPKFKNPYDRNSITSLLFLEDTNKAHSKEKSIVKQLVEIYVKLIEYYDMIKDPIKTYFIDKMQRVVVNYNKSSTKLNAENFITKNRKNISLKIPLISKELKKGKKLYKLRRLKLQKEIQMNQEIEKKNELRKSYLDELKKFEKNNELNTSIIKDGLEMQKNGIRDKLKKRREKSMTRNIQKSFMGNDSFAGKSSFRKKRARSILPPPRKHRGKKFVEELEIFENNVSGIDINQNLLSKINM